MERDFTQYCEAEGIAFTNAFHHAKLVAAKKAGAGSTLQQDGPRDSPHRRGINAQVPAGDVTAIMLGTT